MTFPQAKLAACVLAGFLAAACGGPVSGPASSRSATATASPLARATASQPVGSASGSLSGVYGTPLLNPQVAVTPSGTYVAWQVSPLGSAVQSDLARIEPRSGRVEATLRLGAQFQQAFAVGRALWVAMSTMAGDEVLRLTPGTLRVTGRWHVGSGAGQPYEAQVLAVAGGGLWADGGDRLVRFSLKATRVVKSIVLPRAADSDLSANAAGTVLVVGEADRGGVGAAELRDPHTGTLLTSRAVEGVTAPVVAGPIGSVVWISEATGMMGYVQRLDLATLAPAGSACAGGSSALGGGAQTCLEGTNAIRARLAGGLLWVTQPAGGRSRNYCGRPSDGSAIAPIRLPDMAEDEVLAIAPRWIFYAAPGPRAAQYMRLAAIPVACR